MPKIANIYMDKQRGTWYFVASLGFDEITGERIQKKKRGFKTQKDAKQAYDHFMKNHSESAISRNSTMDYETFLFTYFIPDYKQSVKQRTFENRISSIELHFKYFYRMKLIKITPAHIKKWQNKLTERYSNAYIRNICGLLQKSFDLAVRLGFISKNPVKIAGNVKKERKKVDFWTKEEFEKVISTFDRSDYYEHYSFILIWFLFMTGIRLGEMQALEWSDLDFETAELNINKSMYYKNAKEFYLTDTKTPASNRVIILDDITKSNLSDWKAVQQAHGVSKYVISYNGLPTNKSTSKHIITRHSKLANVHPIKTHSLRHSHASLLISLGENALIIKDRLGHEDVTTTLGTYGHLYSNANKDVANKLNGIITVKVVDGSKTNRFNVKGRKNSEINKD